MSKLKKLLLKSVCACLLIALGNHSSMAQEKGLTPEKIDSFIEYIEDHAIPINKYLSNSEDLSTFLNTLKLTGQLEVLDSGEEFTVFAPTNWAFHQFPKEVTAELLSPSNKDKLKSIVTYHIVKGRLDKQAIIEDIERSPGKVTQIRTLNGLDLTAYYQDGELFLKDDNGYSIEVLEQNILLSNGSVFKIDTVILPQVDNNLVER